MFCEQRVNEAEPAQRSMAGMSGGYWYVLLAAVVIVGLVAGGFAGYFLAHNLWQPTAAAPSTTLAPAATGTTVPLTTSTAQATTNSTSALGGRVVTITPYGASLLLPSGWSVTKDLTIDGGMSWFEATGPQGSFLRCICEIGWTDWKPDPESYHEGDKANLLTKQPSAVDISLGDAEIGGVSALRWEYSYTSGGERMIGIAHYFPRDASFNPSELAIRFPDAPAMLAEVQLILEGLQFQGAR